MKEIIFAVGLILLSGSALRADPPQNAQDLESKIHELEKQLQDAVDQLNSKLLEEDKSASSESDSSEEDDVVDPFEGVHKRLSAIEERLTAIEVAQKDTPPSLDGARTGAEAEATKKANETAPQLKITPAVAQYNLAFALLKNNELEKAHEAFEQIIKDHPSDIYAQKAQFHLGDIFKKLGKLDQAEVAYSQALTFKLETPTMVESRLGLAETLIGLNKVKPACDQLTILQKEALDADQGKRLHEALKKSGCPKVSAPK